MTWQGDRRRPRPQLHARTCIQHPSAQLQPSIRPSIDLDCSSGCGSRRSREENYLGRFSGHSGRVVGQGKKGQGQIGGRRACSLARWPRKKDSLGGKIIPRNGRSDLIYQIGRKVGTSEDCRVALSLEGENVVSFVTRNILAMDGGLGAKLALGLHGARAVDRII